MSLFRNLARIIEAPARLAPKQVRPQVLRIPTNYAPNATRSAADFDPVNMRDLEAALTGTAEAFPLRNRAQGRL